MTTLLNAHTANHQPCATGCTLWKQHRTDCDRQPCTVARCKVPGHRDYHCTGCLPRPAGYGTLCDWCYQRLASDVAAAPELVTHLREIAQPHGGRKPMSDDVKSSSDPAEGSILSAAIDAADEIHANLASWAMLVTEQRDGIGAGPDQTGWWQSRTHHKTDPQTGEIYVSHRRPVGLLRDQAHLTHRLVAWLTPHLDWCAAQDWGTSMRTELGDLIGTTTARWPMTDYRTRDVNGVACVRCKHRALTYTPTTYYRAQFKVTCTNPDCGRIYSEDEWDATIAKLTIDRGRIA